MENQNAKIAGVISAEQAEKEVTAWLDYKKVSKRKRETLKRSIEVLTSAIEEGDISIDDKTFEITQNLKFPLGVNGETKTLKYKPRISVDEINSRTILVKDNDARGTTFATVAALTGGNSGVISKADTEDYNLMDHITVFFVV